jgi:serine/threonine-protein kinase
MADSFMGILTKHLVEAPVPPRQRRPDLEIPADVEAVCLRALEKDREKRWPDMDAFYRALGAAGGVPFEPSNVFVPPTASLKYPALADANPLTRESKTAISVSPPTGMFEDERPQRPDDAAAGLGPRTKIGLAVGAVLAVVLVVILALRPSARPPAVTAAPPVPAAPSPTSSPLPLPAAPAPVHRAEPARVEAAPATPEPPAGKPSARPHHHHDEAKGDPLHRRVDAPPEPTPAELKNPFSAP